MWGVRWLGTDLWCYFFDVNVLADDGRVFATEFKGYAFEGLAGGLHDFLSCMGRASEADFGRSRMSGQPSRLR